VTLPARRLQRFPRGSPADEEADGADVTFCVERGAWVSDDPAKDEIVAGT
jgi:hypothetical protein